MKQTPGLASGYWLASKEGQVLTLDASAAVVHRNVEDPCRTGSRLRRVLMFVGLTGFVLATAVAAPVAADPSPCPMGGGWELYTEAHPAVEATDRNGDGYVCARFYDHDRVPHRAVLTDNRA